MKKVLVADDEPNIRSMVSKMLGKEFIVIEAANGEEAVDMARKQKPDIILMDLMMPQMDGYNACSKIKMDKETEPIPVIILSAIGNEYNKKFALEMGAEGYVTKPFTAQELLEAVKKFI